MPPSAGKKKLAVRLLRLREISDRIAGAGGTDGPRNNPVGLALLGFITQEGRVSFEGYRAFFFNDTATTEIYTLSLHDALPISRPGESAFYTVGEQQSGDFILFLRSEEHTSELQSLRHLVCRLLLEKKGIPHTGSTPLSRSPAATPPSATLPVS